MINKKYWSKKKKIYKKYWSKKRAKQNILYSAKVSFKPEGKKELFPENGSWGNSPRAGLFLKEITKWISQSKRQRH